MIVGEMYPSIPNNLFLIVVNLEKLMIYFINKVISTSPNQSINPKEGKEQGALHIKQML